MLGNFVRDVEVITMKLTKMRISICAQLATKPVKEDAVPVDLKVKVIKDNESVDLKDS